MPLLDGVVYDKINLIKRIVHVLENMIVPETLHIEAKGGQLYVFSIGPVDNVHLQGAKCLFMYEFDEDEKYEIDTGETTPEAIATNIVSFLESQQSSEAR